MRSPLLAKFFQRVLPVLGGLLLVPLVLVAWLAPDLANNLASYSGRRRKPKSAEIQYQSPTRRRRKSWSAEAKFFLLVFVILLVIGGISWLAWHRLKA
ncbi:hypothetical protein GCM10023185_44160 [Hymenobacter saemangeumensis]|uniref:Uncharacterized protein n=1 Tax=Hymenobacter saemangeumensis TaxID=1084522 RepID=A0ABP8ISY7_9BACT